MYPELNQDLFQRHMERGNLSVQNSRDGLFELDEEWTTPLAKVAKLPFDHESWQFAKEVLIVPNAHCRKVGDEARSLAARHIIDRIRELNLQSQIEKEAPRIRSAVELLSKPDADYVHPPFQFATQQIRKKYPEIYESVLVNIGLKIPQEMKPSSILVSLSKQMLENDDGELDINWGKFASILALTGGLAVDSINAEYPEGVTELIETFGVLTEQVMGEWIVSDKPGEGGGWEGFIRLNIYQAVLPPVPRTFLILLIAVIPVLFILKIFISFYYIYFSNVSQENSNWLEKLTELYGTCPSPFLANLTQNQDFCPNPKNPLHFINLTKIPFSADENCVNCDSFL